MAFKNSVRTVLDGTTVGSADLDAGAVNTAALGALAVTTAKVALLAITGATQSVAAATKTLEKTLTTFPTSGSTEFIFVAPQAGVLSGVTLSGKDALATDNTNYQTFALTNKGQAGAGSTLMLSQTAGAATTKITGGQALVAYGKCIIPLHATAANLVVAKGDTLVFTTTASGTPANTVTEPVLSLDFLVTT